MSASPRHTDREYAAQLTAASDAVVEMADAVQRMIHDAVAALVARDEAAARQIIADDAAIDQAEMDIDRRLQRVLARWQPMASDLRLVLQCSKMVTDLERIADLAVNIAERVVDLSKEPQLTPFVDIPRMGEIAIGMVRDAIVSFVDWDADGARAVVASDDGIDALYAKVFTEVLTVMISDPARVHRGIHVLSVIKWLERMGDHATNLAEAVIMMVEGTDVRHDGLDDGLND